MLSVFPRPEWGLLHIDLDHFKEINDTKGHGHGDSVLVYLAHILRTSARKGDFVARIGGDEFVVAVNHTNRVEMERLALRIVKTVDEPNIIENESCRLSVSVGIAVASTAR